MSDHCRLPKEQRFVLNRVVVASETAKARRNKIQSLDALHERAIFIDGYNVLISAESLLGSKPVYLCDDGFLRDTQGIFKSYRTSEITIVAICAIFDLLMPLRLDQAEVLLDKQISMSGQLAELMRRIMAEHGIPGTAKTAQNVDQQLKERDGVIATADGSVIDAASDVVDLPAILARTRGFRPLII